MVISLKVGRVFDSQGRLLKLIPHKISPLHISEPSFYFSKLKKEGVNLICFSINQPEELQQSLSLAWIAQKYHLYLSFEVLDEKLWETTLEHIAALPFVAFIASENKILTSTSPSCLHAHSHSKGFTLPHDGPTIFLGISSTKKPQAIALAGRIIREFFHPKKRAYRLEFRTTAQSAEMTEIYLPYDLYPEGCRVEISDGHYEKEPHSHRLFYRHNPKLLLHSIWISPHKKTLLLRWLSWMCRHTKNPYRGG